MDERPTPVPASDGGAATGPAAIDPAVTDPVLEALWERARAAWDDDKIHVAVLEYALRAQALPEVAGRYRALVGDPERGARAQKRLDALVVAATATLFATKTPKPGKVPLPVTLSAFGVCALLLGWLAWALWGPR